MLNKLTLLRKKSCQAQVQIQSRSIPGPFQIYFKSFQSIPIQNQMIWTRSWCYFHCVTTTHPPKKLLLELILTQNQYRLTSNHDILIIWWRQVSCHPRLQLQTLWMGVILTGKMPFWGDKCLTKVHHAMKIGILNIPASVRMTPCPHTLQLQLCGWGSSYLSKGSY